MSLFDKAKKKEPVKKAKAGVEKFRVKPSDIEQEELFDILSEMEELQKKEKAIKAKFAMLSNEVKEVGIEEFTKLFEKTGKYPGTFMLESVVGDKTAQIMFMPTDRYIKIDKKSAKDLKESFGEEVVTETTDFGFDAKMLEKYGEEISDAIMNSDIPDEDKGKIITATTTYTVAKGSIENMKDFSEKSGTSIGVVMEKIKPVISVRGAEVITS